MTELADRKRSFAAHRFRALGDETRLRLLELLTSGERTVGDLMDSTGLGQSLVSHHLRALRRAGVVTTRRDGRWIHYATSSLALASVRTMLGELEPVPLRGSAP